VLQDILGGTIRALEKRRNGRLHRGRQR
jgi:hypothetical protein